MEGQEPTIPQPPNPGGAPGVTPTPADVHLNRLLAAEVEDPWYLSLVRNIRDLINPPKLPPLEVTSKPVAVKDIWGTFGHGKQAGVSSTLIHVGVAALLFTVASNRQVQQVVKRAAVTLVEPSPYIPEMKPDKKPMGGGGGGGDRSPLPASKGRAPKFAPRQFTPPMAVVNNQQPKLIMEPTLIGPTNAKLPDVNMLQYGDPLAKVGPPSNGPGSGGGIGNGTGGGIGPGDGPGYGPGRGGGFGGGVYRVGGGVSQPVPIFKVEPEYSEEARKAKFGGICVLQIVVDESGVPRNMRVVQPLGLGLDAKAIEAVQKWRFKPALKDGRPVAVLATVEVNFRLL